ncbi:MAG: cobyrinate a,c-diamide synthase [Omnitrophica bacterium]|nr:cobyrinate a,c-diamide synthase [Candidatus Omnitrophota bacterium]
MSNGLARVILAGTHSGVGKTTITIGLLEALRRRGISVQPYKVGPDYIDTGFHSDISGRASGNLDSYFLTPNVLRELFSRKARQASFSLIEGVMGLYDGLASNPAIGSTAHVAKILKAPVILIVDANKIAASAGAVVLGYKKFDPYTNIAGCIVNRVAGRSHYRMLKESIEKNCGIKVLGYLPRDNSFVLAERHLGLRPTQEVSVRRVANRIAKAVEEFIDIGALVAVGKNAPALPAFKHVIFATKPREKNITIAVARDKSFHFYYQDNLDILEYLGARLCFFSPMKSKKLPVGTNGVYIGGGFPEMFAKELGANRALLTDLKARSRENMPIYAECAGLMYLMKELRTHDKRIVPMAGIFPGRTQMGKKLRMFGYYKAKTRYTTILGKKGSVCKGHMFHWSHVIRMPKREPYVFSLAKRTRAYRDGYMRNNTVATYLHFHFASNIGFAKTFIESCRKFKLEKYVNA